MVPALAMDDHLKGSIEMNAYPELPKLDYVRTSVAMSDVITYLRSFAVAAAIKRMVYVIFRNESANGQSGINHNYVGAQADSGRWPASIDRLAAGTVETVENGTGRRRLFLAFRSWTASVDFLVDRVTARGLYIGGTTHRVLTMTIASEQDLVRAYVKEWVRGDASAEPSPETLASFRSMYSQAIAHFRDDPTPPGGFQDHPAAVAESDPDNSSDALNDRQLAHGSFPAPRGAA